MLATPIRRFYSLDVLRGLAALGVVFWHWQHFFFVGDAPGVVDQNRMPFNSIASVFYARGWLAVEMFFTISGFIFYWLYADVIATKKMKPVRFALFRFSRLWPLYITTLVVVTLLQAAYFHLNSSFFVYPNNRPFEFLLHLLVLSVWTDQSLFSFNAPAWSISVEVSLYCLFFLTCRFLPLRAWLLLLLVFVGQVLYEVTFAQVLRGIEPFFLGGLMFFLYREVVNSGRAVAWTWWISLTTVFAWAASLSLMYSAITPHNVSQLPLLWRFEHRISIVFADWPRLVLFPALVLSLALMEHARGSLGKRVAFLGDISYSSYLLHFPLQLAAVLIVQICGLSRDVFFAPLTMITFFVVLVSLSFMTHRFLEMPAQAFLRSLASPRRSRPSRVALHHVANPDQHRGI